jgi:hypothetical protein
LQDAIAGVVAEPVVDLLEVVEVQQHQGQRLAKLDAGPVLGQPTFERASVGQPGERILRRLAGPLVAQPGQFHAQFALQQSLPGGLVLALPFDGTQFLQRRKRGNQVAQQLFATGQPFQGLEQILLRTTAAQHFQRFTVVLAGTLGFVQGLVATRHLGKRQALVGPHPELSVTGHQRAQRFGGLAVAAGGLQHDGVVAPGHQGQTHLTGGPALLGQFQPVLQVGFHLRPWPAVFGGLIQPTADAVEVGQPRVALFVASRRAVQKLAGLFQARQRVLVPSEDGRDDAHLPQDAPPTQFVTSSTGQGLGMLERRQRGFVIACGTQRARCVDQCIAGTVGQACGLEKAHRPRRQPPGLPAARPGCRARTIAPATVRHVRHRRRHAGPRRPAPGHRRARHAR